MKEKPAKSQTKVPSSMSDRKQLALRKAEAATKSRDHQMRKLFEKQSELEEFRRRTEERIRNLEKQLHAARDQFSEYYSVQQVINRELVAANEELVKHDEAHEETKAQLDAAKEEIVKHRQAHEEIKKQLKGVEDTFNAMASTYHTLRIDTEHLEARIEGLESRPAGPGSLSEAQLALLARVPSRTDLENMGFWVTDSIEVLKKDLTANDQKMKSTLEKRLNTQEKSARTAESKLRKVFMKADLWRFSRAIDESIRHAVKKTLRHVGQAMDVKIDGEGLDLVPSGDFYGMQLDEVRDAEVAAKR